MTDRPSTTRRAAALVSCRASATLASAASANGLETISPLLASRRSSPRAEVSATSQDPDMAAMSHRVNSGSTDPVGQPPQLVVALGRGIPVVGGAGHQPHGEVVTLSAQGPAQRGGVVVAVDHEPSDRLEVLGTAEAGVPDDAFGEAPGVSFAHDLPVSSKRRRSGVIHDARPRGRSSRSRPVTT